MNGSTQQDANEYFLLMLEISLADKHAADAARLAELFEFQTVLNYVCPAVQCGHTSATSAKTSGFHHNLRLPLSNHEKYTLGQAWVDSNTSKTESWCPKCSGQQLESRTTFTKVGESLVMELCRYRYQNGIESKIMSEVEFETTTILVEDREYDLSAVVCHKGRRLDNGHYTIYRKQDGGWYLLDDESCTKSSLEEMNAAQKQKQSTILLFKKRVGEQQSEVLL